MRIVGFAGSVWMVRCMGPETLGVSSLVAATASGFILFIDLGLGVTGTREISINKKDPTTTIETVIGIRIVAAVMAMTIWLGFAAYNVWSRPQHFLAYSMGLMMILSAALNPNWILQGLELLPKQNIVGVVTTVLSSAAYLIIFRPTMPAGADLAVSVTAGFVGIVLMWWFLIRNFQFRLRRIKLAEALVALQNSKLTFFWLITIYVYTQTDSIIVAKYASLEQAGLYRAAQTLLSPFAMVIGVFSALLYPRMAIWANDGFDELSRQQTRVVTYFVAGSIPLFIGTLILGRPLLNFLLEGKFNDAYWAVLLILASKIALLLNGVYGWGLIATRNEKQMLKISLVIACTSLALNSIIVPFWGATGAAAVALYSETLVLASTFFFSRKLHRSAS